MRRAVAAILLECLAVVLALGKYVGGVHTDEAKYLLNIPYPHPPLMRWILSQTVHVPFAELCWRMVFASLVVHAVWLFLKPVTRKEFGLLILAWLSSAAVITQAGTIMMSPLTALSAAVFLYLLRRQCTDVECFWLALFWLASLFTAYQAVLLLPLVLATFVRSRQPVARILLYTFTPILLLALYTLSNPLAAASFGLAVHKDVSVTLAMRAQNFLRLWFFAGSGVVTVFGTMGILLSRRWELIASFLLTTAYIALSNQDYYGILLVPFFVEGCRVLLSLEHGTFSRRSIVMIGSMAMGIGVLWHLPYVMQMQATNAARDTIESLNRTGTFLSAKDILIVGPFGHEWQYYSPVEVVRHSDTLMNKHRDLLLCLRECGEEVRRGMRRVAGMPVEIYVRE